MTERQCRSGAAAAQKQSPAQVSLCRALRPETQAACILEACLPFWPWVTSNWTFWPSLSDLNPCMLIAEKCANRSSPPPSGVMKPKPFASLNHLTVPVAIPLPTFQSLARMSGKSCSGLRNAQRCLRFKAVLPRFSGATFDRHNPIFPDATELLEPNISRCTTSDPPSQGVCPPPATHAISCLLYF